MGEVLKFFSENKDALTAIGIVLTFCVSAMSLYFSVRNNKAVHYVNTITKNRTEWIYKFRDLIAEYIAATNIYDNAFYTTDSNEDMEKSGLQLAHAKELCSKIKLMLNFTDELDGEIISIVDELMEAYSSYYHDAFECDVTKSGYFIETDNMKKQREKIDIMTLELVRRVQIYLKAEWNRVKYESQGKTYEKETQQFDIWELEQKYDNPDYKNQVWKRFCINTKAKVKRLYNSSGYALLIFALDILCFLLLIIYVCNYG